MPNPSPARMHDFEVVTNEKIADGIFSLVILAPRLASALKPGQFVNVRVPGDASELLRIPLSYVAADPQAGTVEIWYAVVGNGTQRMSEWKPGFKSDLLGPGAMAGACPRMPAGCSWWAAASACRRCCALRAISRRRVLPLTPAWARRRPTSSWALKTSRRWVAARFALPPTTVLPAAAASAPIPLPSSWPPAGTTTWPHAVPVS